MHIPMTVIGVELIANGIARVALRGQDEKFTRCKATFHIDTRATPTALPRIGDKMRVWLPII